MWVRHATIELQRPGQVRGSGEKGKTAKNGVFNPPREHICLQVWDLQVKSALFVGKSTGKSTEYLYRGIFLRKYLYLYRRYFYQKVPVPVPGAKICTGLTLWKTAATQPGDSETGGQ